MVACAGLTLRVRNAYAVPTDKRAYHGVGGATKNLPRYTGDVRGWDWLLARCFYSLVALYANYTVDRLDAGFKNSTVRRTGT